MRRLSLVALLVSTQAYAGSVEDMLNQAADRHGISRPIVQAVATVESSKRCGLIDGPHRGILQVSRGAAKEVEMPWPFATCEDEIEAGVRYLELALKRGGSGCYGITLYNEGIYAPLHCSNYGRRVMAVMNKEM